MNFHLPVPHHPDRDAVGLWIDVAAAAGIAVCGVWLLLIPTITALLIVSLIAMAWLMTHLAGEDER